jgi:anti-sigma-K factor RskA
MVDQDKDVLAAEYVLGTLGPDERAEAQALIAIDSNFAEVVRGWERRLGELSAMVDPVEPPADMWERIKAGVAVSAKPAPAEAAAAPAVVPPVPAPTPAAAPTHGAEIIDLTRRLNRWRTATAITGALAACFLALVIVRETNPDVLPEPLQPRARTVEVVRTVEVPSTRPAEFVAVFQKDDASPAFLLTFDLDKRTLTVRRVGAEQQAGKSYELWLVSDKYPGPRSLGVIGAGSYTVQQAAPEYDPVIINRATYAISLEPEGGSPTGAPTGPVLYHGRLLQTTAPDFPARTP